MKKMLGGSKRVKTRNMKMSPDLDYKIDADSGYGNSLDMEALAMGNLERNQQLKAREELKKVLMRQRIQIEKNTKLYKELNSRLTQDVMPS